MVTPVGNEPRIARKSCPSIAKGYLTGAAPAGALGTQMGVRHCIPATQSAGP
jgi:hypothetical protein